MSEVSDFFLGNELEFAIYQADPAHPNLIEPDSICSILSKTDFIAFAKDVYQDPDNEYIQDILNHVIFDGTIDMALEVISHCCSYNVVVGSALKQDLHRD